MSTITENVYRLPAGMERMPARMFQTYAVLARMLEDDDSPTLAQIRDACGLTSLSAAMRRVDELVQAGALTRERWNTGNGNRVRYTLHDPFLKAGR